MDWKDIAFAVLGTAITALTGTGIGVLVAWLKNLAIVKKLNLDALIDKLAASAVNYAEALGRNLAKKGTEKLQLAKNAFEAELAKNGIKLDAGQINERLESILNKLKAEIEHK